MPLVNILLPICEEMDIDVFLQVLKNITARKLDEHYLVSALKYGMSGQAFSIEEEELTLSWENLNSRQQRIHQSKLLGFWVIENFPSLRKKLNGNGPKITNQFKQTYADEINALISKKLKLRVLQLDVSDSTLSRLKDFVNAPANIGKKNETQISKQMKSFDIDDDWIDHCWKALKSGEFPSAILQVNFITSPGSLPHPENEESQLNCENDSISVASKRAYVDILEPNEGDDVSDSNGDSSTGSSSVQIPKRAHMDDVNVNGNISNFCGSNFDVITASLLIIRNDIGHLTHLFQERANERSAGEDGQNLHIVMLKQKDDEIFQLKGTIKDLRHINDNLTNYQSKSMKQIEEQTSLISALQLGMEATSKLLEQSERDKIASLDLVEVTKHQLAESTETILRMDDEIKNVNGANQKLREEVSILNQCSNELSFELKSQIEALTANMAATETMLAEKIGANIQLQDDIAVSERCWASKEDELKDVRRALSEIEIANLKSVEATKRQLAESAETIQRMDDEIKNLNEGKQKLCEDVSILSQGANELSSELKGQIEALAANLAAAEKLNAETITANIKLREDLAILEGCLTSREDELNDVRGALSKIQKPIETSDIGSQTVIYNKIEEMTAKNSGVDKVYNMPSESVRYGCGSQDKQSQPVESSDDVVFNRTEGHDGVQELHSKNIGAVGDEMLKRTCSAEGENQELHLKLYPEPVNMNAAENEMGDSVFVTDDPIVQQCRPVLLKQTFGWMKFQKFKNCKYHPGFVYPADADGIERAQKVKSDGYVTNMKNEFFDFHEKLPGTLKLSAEKLALKKFNERFRLSFE